MSNIQLLTPEDFEDYELIDSGNEQKLERFGPYYLIRPDNQAIWKPRFSYSEWEGHAHAVLKKAPLRQGTWQFKKEFPKQWQIGYKGLKFSIKLTPFGHVGVFPEQASQWDWVEERIKEPDKPLRILNLFAYSGISSIAAARAGATVCHVDASKAAINWAAENQKASNLQEKPIRWIIDDALKFVKREARRGQKYDAIIMDPPKFGRGPNGETWQFEDLINELLSSCKEVLSDNPKFIIINAYAVEISSITLANLMSDLVKNHKGEITYGELGLRESKSERILPTSFFARWQKSS